MGYWDALAHTPQPVKIVCVVEWLQNVNTSYRVRMPGMADVVKARNVCNLPLPHVQPTGHRRHITRRDAALDQARTDLDGATPRYQLSWMGLDMVSPSSCVDSRQVHTRAGAPSRAAAGCNASRPATGKDVMV